MSDQSTAVVCLWEAQSAHAGEPVIYTRGESSVNLTAVPGFTHLERVIDDAVAMKTKHKDWLVLATDLDLGSGAVLPERGDTITFGSDVYKVLPIAGETVYDWSDSHKTILRIHTKLNEVTA